MLAVYRMIVNKMLMKTGAWTGLGRRSKRLEPSRARTNAYFRISRSVY